MDRIDFTTAFGPLDANTDVIREYWRDLRANWQAAESSLRRTVFYVGALGLTFALLLNGGLSEVAFLGLKFKDLDFVLLAIPVITGYLTYVAFTLASISARLATAHDDLMMQVWPNAYGHSLDRLVRPVGAFADIAAIADDSALSEFAARCVSAAGVIRFIGLLGLPVLFELFAIAALVREEPGHAAIRVAVIAVSCVCLIACVPHVYYVGKVVTAE